MPRQDDKDFRPRSGRRRAGAKDGSFLSRVLLAAGPGFAKSLSGKRGLGHLSRGQVAARIGLRTPGPRTRRVVLKARLVVQPGRLRAATLRHGRYLEREPAGEPGHLIAYGPETDTADIDALAERCADDRHQFRFIVSPEDGVALDDLKLYTRTLMQQVERDLQTKLDWVAVDHRDTDNPHSHVLLRGKAADGQDLVIDREYISRGMRLLAQEIATDWLGPRTEREIQASRDQELVADRVTPLDRALQREAVDGLIDLRQTPAMPAARQAHALKLGRLAHLATLGLAEESRPGRWQLAPNAGAMLKDLGEREDMIQTVRRAVPAPGTEIVIFDKASSRPVTGSIAARGLRDELTEEGYLVVQGIDSRAHYLRLPGKVNLADLPVGGIVRTQGDRLFIVSALPIARQTQALGATWLDAQLVAGGTDLGTLGFGAEVRAALAVRAEFLIGEGLADRQDGQLRLAKDLLPALRNRELAAVASRHSPLPGMTYRHVPDGRPGTGVYLRSVQLVSGRYALLGDGRSFSLVPWRRELERGVQRGITMDGPGRGRGRGIGR
jgi:type IV secretory pathway VirD2 relaxase